MQNYPDQAQRQPGRGGIASGGQRAAPLRQCPAQEGAPEERPVESSQGHRGNSAQTRQANLFHAEVRPGVRGRQRRILRTSVPAAGVERCKTAIRATRLPVGAHVRWSAPRPRSASQPGGRLKNPVSGEQSYARDRPVHRRLTGESTPAVTASHLKLVHSRNNLTARHT